MTNNISQLPTPGVVLDLDLEQRDPKDVRPAFVVQVGGQPITMKDPSEVDWQDLAAMADPRELLPLVMSSEDRRHLAKTALPGWKFNRLMEAYYAHYDLDEKIRQAKRQASLG